MLRTGLRLLFALALVAVVGAPAQAAPPSIDRTPEFVKRVNDAVDRGVEWLRSAADESGAFPGYSLHPCGVQALAYQTLRVGGVAKNDPDAVRVWASMRREYTSNGGRASLKTYTAALLLMAIAEHGERVREPNSDREVKLDAADRSWADEIVQWLVRAQNDDGTWTYAAGNEGPYAPARNAKFRMYDYSNTQYALLGLKAAARCGLPVDSRVWLRSMTHFLASQEKGGVAVPRREGAESAGKGSTSAAPVTDRARGWGYTAGDEAYGSMTAGGVGSIVICRSELLGSSAMTKALDAQSETAVRDGLAWLGQHFTVRSNPGPRRTMAGPTWHAYYLYAIERAGVLAGVEWMGQHDWYGEGAEYLCGAQASDGGWTLGMLQGPGGRGRVPRVTMTPANAHTVLDTCFALLFLKKGTIPVRRGALTQAADETDIRFDQAVNLTGQDFEDFLDLVLQRWRRTEDDAVRGRLFAGATTVGPKIVEPLLIRLDAPDLADREAAHALLRHATGRDFGFAPSASRELREASVTAWHAWWMGARDRMVYDGTQKRLVELR